MICPRCGTTNAPGRATCVRCSGSLAPPPEVTAPASAVPPVLPVTRRAEIATGRATPKQSPRPAASKSPGPVAQWSPEHIYLLAHDRCTGQPAPPEVPPAPVGHTRSGLGGLVAMGLSGG